MSVRKRAWTTRKGEKKEAWIVDYTDQEGDRHIETFARKRDADAYHAKISVEIGRGVHIADSKSVTVAEAGRRWIASGEAAGLERTTLEQYRQHLKFHILPYLGERRLSQLTVPMIRDFQDRLRAGRSAAMVRKVIGSLGSLVADAQERGLVAQNVVRGLSRRKRGQHNEKRHKGKLEIGVDIPASEEIRAIIATLEGRWRPLLLTAIFTGLRASELRGLRWQDINLKKGELHVRQRADRFNRIGKPKSASSERTLPLPPILVNTLREWKLACPKGDPGLVFPNGIGRIESHANIINRALIPAQIAAGVVDRHAKAKYTGLHVFRHYYASWCINRRTDGGLELPLKLVQARLGHASIQMTADRYGHLFERADDGTEMAAAEQTLHAT
ncbi:MAG TPA: site-specific integrase [Xanthobacteraceae bacterium]|jgi:integrase|nr:site-specific integrase [Xanthobacteraceae bacterium]